MSADMFVGRFLTELRRLPAYQTQGKYDALVHKAQAPAWRATFTAGVLARHVAGYKLPSLEHFVKSYMRNLGDHAKFDEKFSRFTEGGKGRPTAAFLHRLSQWYEIGMTEVYVYVTLAHVVEDILQEAVVMYDARVDWKGKCDLIILRGGEARMVDTHFLAASGRAQTEVAREERERVAKQNTMQSAHWENAEYKQLKQNSFTVVRDEKDCWEVNGFKLFSDEAMNKLLREVYEWLGAPEEKRVWIETLKKAKPGEDIYEVQQRLMATSAGQR